VAKNSIFLTFAGTVLAVTVIGIALSIAIAAADDNVRRDSQGIPCTISTAQNADGTPECK
jgi:hypothetical protein